MRNLIILCLVSLCFIGCSRVPPGNVGVKVYLLGGAKGVDSVELGVGRYWIGFNEELHLFPTFTQNHVWTRASTEGSINDDSFKFQTVEGMTVGADVGISYAIDPAKVTKIFQKYRKGVDEITDIYLRNMVRDAFVTEASTRQIQDVYGAGKAKLIKDVEKRVRGLCDEIGINVEKIYLIGELRLPTTVMKALNAKIEATQKAQQRENEIQQTKAEAEKVREEAKGRADAILFVAKAEAKAIKLKGNALKNNPHVVQLSAIDKWDGVLPKMNGASAIPFLDVSKIDQ